MPVVTSAPNHERLIWSLWLAAGIVFLGGALPILFGGTSSRITGVYVPFTIAALALVACALLHNQSRTVVAIVYFVAGLAIVYGLLSMFSLPMRLAAMGSCPVAPYPCTTGLPRALSDGENTGLGVATAFGIGALLLGFFGLATLYRRPVIATAAPPVRRIPPMPPSKPAEPAPKPAEPVAAKAEPEPEPELPAHDEEELPELPPHESTTPTT